MKRVYDGFLKVDVKDVLLKNGSTVKREVVHTTDSVGMVCHNADGSRFYFTYQYRPGADKGIIEIPAGRIDEGETPEQAAWRETCEEIGWNAVAIEKIAQIYVSPGYTDEKITLFDITVSGKQFAQQLDHGEEISIVEMTRDEVKRMMKDDPIDGKTLIALMYFFRD